VLTLDTQVNNQIEMG